VILGPVAANYNGALPAPPVPPVSNVTITDCDFGTPGDMKQPVFIYNVKDLVLKNVTIGGVAHNETLSA
jgi:hypothetical protein